MNLLGYATTVSANILMHGDMESLIPGEEIGFH